MLRSYWLKSIVVYTQANVKSFSWCLTIEFLLWSLAIAKCAEKIILNWIKFHINLGIRTKRHPTQSFSYINSVQCMRNHSHRSNCAKQQFSLSLLRSLNEHRFPMNLIPNALVCINWSRFFEGNLILDCIINKFDQMIISDSSLNQTHLFHLAIKFHFSFIQLTYWLFSEIRLKHF